MDTTREGKNVMGAMILLLLGSWGAGAPTTSLRVEMVGNAGVLLSDQATTLLVDLPYESGAFGYQRWTPASLRPPGRVVSVITHHHRDHFDPTGFLERPDWQVIGPQSAVAGLPPARILLGDSIQVGDFHVVAIPSPHTPDHRSYRIRWHGRTLFFVGDTEAPETIPSAPRPDVLFITPWLSCAVEAAGRDASAYGARSIGYHLRPDGSDRICGPVEVLDQGSSFSLPDATEQEFEVVDGAFLAVQVADDARAAAWYAATLDLQEVNHLEAPDGRYSIRILEGRGLVVELIRLEGAAAPPDPPIRGLFKAGFFVDDIDAAFAVLRARGVDMDARISTDAAIAARTFVFRDPDGTRLQVFERCFATCADPGALSRVEGSRRCGPPKESTQCSL